jgi:hypothetical protein
MSLRRATLSAEGSYHVGTPPGRPCRVLHHASPDAGLIGGGTIPGPDEVSLAHPDVLMCRQRGEMCRRWHTVQIAAQCFPSTCYSLGGGNISKRPWRVACFRNASQVL